MTSSPRRRLLVVHPDPELYGASRMLIEVVDALKARGDHVVAVFSEAAPVTDAVQKLGVETRVVDYPVLRKSLIAVRPVLELLVGLPNTTRRLRAVVRSARPDLVYVSTLTAPHWLLAARSLGVPTVCHVHEAEDQIAAPLALLLTMPLLLADEVIVNSDATAAFVRRHLSRMSTRTRVVLNGFDIPSPGPPLHPRVRRRVLLVGRLSPRKGQDVAVSALQLLVHLGHDAELELVGSCFRGYEWCEESLRDQAVRLGLGDRVIFSGYQDSVWEAYRHADVVIVPSRVEPFGNVAVEAMGMAKPVIAARVGGLPEIVSEGKTGLLCPPDDPCALAAALSELLSDPAKARSFGERGAAVARSHFSRKRFREEVLSAVDHVAARAQRYASDASSPAGI